ncbi:hypothetical protein HPB49_017133 [Dermacentor silvarum]|uniref:Uncharacterized protein n=1 Tax=Dermacentor silvarum TaxID=543639 RepID=A0ACB8DJU9_DERSI|nr:uncharacterized protein LOC119434030 [Dermacentor silvarum]KAH7970948.1 hypothetical protein HPB49_017133 [Dermacentor silvarum]
MSAEPAKTDSKAPHAGEGTESVAHATTELPSEHDATEPSADHTENTASRVSHGGETTTSPGHHVVEADAECTGKKSSAECTGSEISPENAGAKSSAERAASEGRDKHTDRMPSTERSETAIGSERPGTEPSSERAATETTAKPAAEEPKAEPTVPRRDSKAVASAKVGTGAAPQLPASSDGAVPGYGVRLLELVGFAIVVAIVIVIGAAMFDSAYRRDLKTARPHADDDPLETAIYRRGRSWHGYGPQLLVCTLGERRRLGSPDSLPPDGLCDLVVYTHVQSLGADFEDGASANLRVLWARASTAVKTRFGYSFSNSLLPIDERQLGGFVRKAVDDKSIRVFGMLDARWDGDATNVSYATFAAALKSTTRQLPKDERAALVFGVPVGTNTSAHGVEFWESHAAMLDHVHVLVYQAHVDLPPQNASAKGKCVVRFPSPRFQQAENSDQTMQDGVAAIDTALHFRQHNLTTDICVSIALSGHRFSLEEAATEGQEQNAKCVSASAVAYGDVCPNGTSSIVTDGYNVTPSAVAEPTVRFAGEGVLVSRKEDKLLDAFDDVGTLAEKLRTAKLALSLSEQPHWSFCLAAFNVEHEDSEGACGHDFERLTVARSFLQGKLRWHDD